MLQFFSYGGGVSLCSAANSRGTNLSPWSPNLQSPKGKGISRCCLSSPWLQRWWVRTWGPRSDYYRWPQMWCLYRTDIFHVLLTTQFCWQWKQSLVVVDQRWSELLSELKLCKLEMIQIIHWTQTLCSQNPNDKPRYLQEELCLLIVWLPTVYLHEPPRTSRWPRSQSRELNPGVMPKGEIPNGSSKPCAVITKEDCSSQGITAEREESTMCRRGLHWNPAPAWHLCSAAISLGPLVQATPNKYSRPSLAG